MQKTSRWVAILCSALSLTVVRATDLSPYVPSLQDDASPPLANLTRWADPDEELDHAGRSPYREDFDRSPRVKTLKDSFTDGTATVEMGTGKDTLRAIKVLTDGRVLMLGRVESADYTFFNIGLARVHRDGSLDTTFNTTGKVVTTFGYYDDWPHGLVLTTNGQFAIAGRGSNGNNLDFAVLRYNSNGTLDTSFKTVGGVLTTIGSSVDIARSIAFDASNRLVVGGYRFDGAKHDTVMVRYLSDGSLDTSFATTGKVVWTLGTEASSITAIVLLTDGRLGITGGLHLAGGEWDAFAGRVNTDGTLDTSFNTLGYAAFSLSTGADVGYGIQFTSAGLIYIGGNGLVASGRTAGFIARYQTNGVLDTSFRSQGYTVVTGANDFAGNGVWVNWDGGATLGGTLLTTTGAGRLFLYRVTSAGAAASFGTSGLAVNSALVGVANGYAIARRGAFKSEYFIAGSVLENDWDFALARYDEAGGLAPSGSLDRSWATGGTSIDTAVSRVSRDGLNRIFIQHFTINRYKSDGSLDTSFATRGIFNPPNAYYGAPAIDSTHRMLWASMAGLYPIVGRTTTNGSLDTSFGTIGYKINSNNNALSLNPSSTAMDALDRLLVVGYKTSNANGGAVFRFTTDGILDTSFATVGYQILSLGVGVTNTVFTQIKGDTAGRAWVSGYVTTDTPGTSFLLARFSTNGTLDTTLNTIGFRMFRTERVINSMDDFFLDADNRVLAAGSSAVDEAPSTETISLFRFTSNGNLDTSFGGGSGLYEIPIVIPGQFFVRGLAPSTYGQKIFASAPTGFYRFTSNGFLDTGFGTSGYLSGTGGVYNLYDDGEGLVMGINGMLRRMLP